MMFAEDGHLMKCHVMIGFEHIAMHDPHEANRFHDVSSLEKKPVPMRPLMAVIRAPE